MKPHGDSATTLNTLDRYGLVNEDKTRPASWKGDILLGNIKHQGNLAVGEDYLGSTQVTIPDGLSPVNIIDRVGDYV